MTTYSDPAYSLRSALLTGIRDGRWRPGERIPTERALCDTHAVGRSTVRRVLAELKEAGHEADVRARTGLVLDPYFSATKAAWILDHVPGAREITPPPLPDPGH